MPDDTLSTAKSPLTEKKKSVAKHARHDPLNRSDPLWFKDAVIYELHIKAFFDSNDDGIGDFPGLIQKLDYLKSLGVTALWLLPFYPSPLKDDGYDIADYLGINPSYGTMRDFRKFVQACHERNLRVITELVINHTSDQHPWFQRARRAKAGSAYRNYYVWSDSDQKYKDARIIFLDSEKSNWSWDPVAQAYYWHRFYSHQPDLNFDNPRVMEKLVGVLNTWLEMGVDGLRLDAVPYLVERESTSCESLPETHAVLKAIRAKIDASFPDRMLLAEANQWPEDVRPYFGDGDECHMAFHFPLMPRMYMAIAQEDRHPITDIMRQTPDIPDTCQWAIFLRNHDELTLEMVTNKERDYLWSHYAGDRRARLNLGIRRRLAPLMDNDRRKIELMNGLLFAFPGTPVLYYGDEIGMGDNVFAGDRDGVRTPMQWSPDRNGGFSRCDPARIFLPPIMDAIYGYGAVNVEAQLRSPSSLLNWTRRMLAVRQENSVFGRGTLQFLYPGNRKVLAFLRNYADQTVLCVFNLSRAAQAVEIDLARFKGRVPVELLGRSIFPPVGDALYQLALPAYAFYWFVLAEAQKLPSWHEPIPEPTPEFVTIVIREGWRDIWNTPARELLENEALPPFLVRRRWFAAKGETISTMKITNAVEFAARGASFLLTAIEVVLASGETQRYFMPLTLAGNSDEVSTATPLVSFTVAMVRRGSRLQSLYDATVSRDFPLAVVQAMKEGLDIPTDRGHVRFWSTSAMGELALPPDAEVTRLGVEQSNSSVLVGGVAVLKLFRKVAAGINPEVEICRFLTEAGYANTPPLLGALQYVDANDASILLATAQGYVRNQGSGWEHALGYIEPTLEVHELTAGSASAPAMTDGPEPTPREPHFELYATLGQRVAELHRVLASPTDNPAFTPEPITPADMRAWCGAITAMATSGFEALASLTGRLPETSRADADDLVKRRAQCLALIEKLCTQPVRAMKTRIHGDLHLGQVLLAQNDWYIIDFEGEPARSLEERRRKHCALRDVAGMLRSFDYVALAAANRITTPVGTGTADIVAKALAWRDDAVKAFMGGYQAAIAGVPSHPADEAEARRLCTLFMIEKACYELRYEVANRPTWADIPIRGLRALLASAESMSENASGGAS